MTAKSNRVQVAGEETGAHVDVETLAVRPDGSGPTGGNGPDHKGALAGESGLTTPPAGKTPAVSPKLPAAKATTPMMAQYLEIKAANPDSLLFYRMGDFYELFFEDAVLASEALGITLTRRGQHEGADIPMAGVPVHAADDYLQRLIRAGFRVAVCEQTEDPAEAKKRGSKAVVQRDVVRLVTPGTLTEDSLLKAGVANFLSAIFPLARAASDTARTVAVASLDISTGAFVVGDVALADLGGELARLLPSEVLLPEGAMGDAALSAAVDLIGAACAPLPDAYFRSATGERDLKAALGVADLAAFGGFSRSELAAIAGLLKYVELTQVGRRAIVRPPIRCGAQDAMVIDAATRANLELVRATGGGRRNTLLEAMDRTVTGPGARELAARIAAPLTRAEDITARLDAVGFLIDARIMREEVRTALRSVPDVARALSRLQLQRGSPRDLGAVRDTLAACATIVQAMEKKAPTALLSGGELPAKLAEFRRTLSAPAPELADALRAALVDQLPSHARDGGYIRAGYHAELDATRRLRDESRAVLAELQATYQSTTAVKALKIKHNNVLGYFVEVTAAHGETLRSETLAETFRHRQTLANAVRFTTDELEDIEQRLTQAGERALAMEAEIYAELSAAALAAHPVLNGVADSLAALDCLQGLAMLADEEGHTRPIVDDSLSFHLQGARHPVVERALRREDGAPFVANDCMLGPSMGDVSSSVAPSDAATEEKKAQPTSPQAPALDPPPGTIAPQEAGPHGGFDDGTQARVWIVTGPNMAGKSTFLRQNALIAVMAQMGAYVPADRAHIGIVDRLFSRVGASDDLARGRSTFMVEMVETAGILNLAGERSLVILDEIGRGTATFDGLSIAWATVEYLQSVNRCRALFATHYHELTALADRLPNIANVTMSVKEWRDDIVFLHKVVRGAASRSYGIQVARLAGLPGPVITRAGEVLRLLEEHERGKPAEALIEDLPLFAAARPANPIAASPDDNDTPLSTALDAINPDMLSPREALDALYRLKDIGGRE